MPFDAMYGQSPVGPPKFSPFGLSMSSGQQVAPGQAPNEKPGIPGWVLPAVIAGASVLSTIFSAREAKKNRDFQERMSSTAHQREVQDLLAAGLNPILSARGGGSSTPSGAMGDFSELGRGLSSAAQLKLMNAQVEREKSQAVLNMANASQTDKESAGRVELLQAQGELAQLSKEEIAQRMSLYEERARAEIAQISNSAAKAEAETVLLKLDRVAAMNAAEVEELISKAPPWTRLAVSAAARAAGIVGVGGMLRRPPTRINNFPRTTIITPTPRP